MRLLAFALALMAAFTSFGVNNADSVNVYFHVGQRQFDPALGENRQQMENFIANVREAANTGNIDYIMVRAYASPDGSNQFNEILARRRCNAIAEYIVEKTGITPSLIRQAPEGIAWTRLRELVEATPEVPSRKAVLDILVNTPLWIKDSKGKVIGSRKSRLMDLDRGVPYRWMMKHLFPELRNAVAITMVTKVDESPKNEQTIVVPDVTECPDTLSIRKPEIVSPEETEVVTDLPDSTVEIIKRSYTNDLLAIKTNLIYDAALMPNLEIEWLINNHWSVEIDGGIAWWKNDPKHKYYQLAYVSPEVRYHIRPRSRWNGMYAGAFLGGGLYDLENGGIGYRGEGGFLGLSFGYMWTVKKRLLFDAEIGLGYMNTRYKEYEPRDGHYLYMRTKTLNYFGPLKLKFSIGWLFGRHYDPINK